ncbi:hypothetical protein AX15_006207 [Amanita polypyramis BW_CC]|nr:hypothetical protein AX15_006207 [Amanita polypyramis BW_CC]
MTRRASTLSALNSNSQDDERERNDTSNTRLLEHKYHRRSQSMFGESESESPRVPSPWDTLVASSPPSRSSSSRNSPDPIISNPNHFIHAVLPRLVPEADSGNVEYKLQLLSPSPTRFARLVTQLKWRLLEGGGQAYYELGVADSGGLVGLSRTEMEMSLETLEMMAGEIGASVVVVKEVEVPEALVVAVKAQQAAGLLLGEERWSRTRRRRDGKEVGGGDKTPTTTETTATDTTDMEGEHEEEEGDLSATVMLCKPVSRKSSDSEPVPVFTMELEPETEDPAENADGEQEQEPESEPGIPSIVIDLEISSVFKPRPVRTRVQSAHLMNQAVKNKRQNKQYKPPYHQGGKRVEDQVEGTKKGGRHRRQHKDRKRIVVPGLGPGRVPNTIPPLADMGKDSGFVSPSPSPSAVSVEPPAVALATVEETDALVSNLESLHVSLKIEGNMLGVGLFMAPPTPAPTPASTKVVEVQADPEPFIFVAKHADATVEVEETGDGDGDDDDDVFPTVPATGVIRVGGVGPGTGSGGGEGVKEEDEGKRIIVEALVVRKMSMEEGFLDFGVFS